MPKVTDPSILAALNGNVGVNMTEGKGGVGTNEAKTQEAEQQARGQNKNLIRMLMEAEVYNRRVPSGRFNVRVNDVVQEFPDSWKSNPQAIADYQAFDGVSRRMVPAAIGAVSGGNFNARMMDAAKEQENAQKYVPSPRDESLANVDKENQLGRMALEQRARTTFTQNWRKRYGTSHATNEAGDTLDVAFEKKLASILPGVGPKKPLTQYLDEAVAKRKANAFGMKVGTIEDGYRYSGGDPANPKSWRKVN